MKRAALVLLVAAAVLASSAAAQAAQRYAAPAGEGKTCSQAAPCSLKTAVESAKSGDEVIVGTGTYPVPSGIHSSFEATNLNVHGDMSGPMPVLEAAIPGGPPLVVSTAGNRLAYLDIRNTAELAVGLACIEKVTIERVRVAVSGKYATGILENNGCTAVRDSLALATGEGAVALLARGLIKESSAAARNVTAVATGSGSVGVRATASGPGPESVSFDLDLKNSILSGEATDLEATGTFLGPGNITVSHSNFDSAKPVGESKVNGGGGNQTGPPLFVNAVGGDYREAFGSPTIDAGVADPLNGVLDLAGSPRVLGAAPDIGAYEYVPPHGLLESLSLSPKAFRPANIGEAVLSATRRRGGKAPVATTVGYSLTESATVAFAVERALPGRRVGKSCRKPTKGNRRHKRCRRWKLVKGGFSVAGAKGAHSFTFTGRLNGKALRPGRYRLLGSANGSLKQAAFRIVR